MKRRILAIAVLFFFFSSAAEAELSNSPRKAADISVFGQPFGRSDIGGPLGNYRFGGPLGSENFGKFWDHRFARDLGPSFLGQPLGKSSFMDSIPALFRSIENIASENRPWRIRDPFRRSFDFDRSPVRPSDFLSLWDDLSQIFRSLWDWILSVFGPLLRYRGPF